MTIETMSKRMVIISAPFRTLICEFQQVVPIYIRIFVLISALVMPTTLNALCCVDLEFSTEGNIEENLNKLCPDFSNIAYPLGQSELGEATIFNIGKGYFIVHVQSLGCMGKFRLGQHLRSGNVYPDENGFPSGYITGDLGNSYSLIEFASTKFVYTVGSEK